ncbi:MAG: family 16 glycosylhydrolase, partial [Bacteroidota bacterium]
AAPVPPCDEADVISYFSDAYTDTGVDTYRTVWSDADFTTTMVDGEDALLYTNLNFVGIETTGGNLIDATGMSSFSFSIWTPNMDTFRVKLVDFGPDGLFRDGGVDQFPNDDTEHEIQFTSFPQSQWVTFNIPLSDFTNLTGTPANIAQLIFSGKPTGAGTVFIDNIFFSNANCVLEEPGDGPQAAAPAPTCDPAEVRSVFSNTYTDVPIATYRTVWSSGSLTETQVAGDDVLLYEDLAFIGIEPPIGNLIDLTDMNSIKLDIWTSNMTLFRVKLVEFGDDGTFQENNPDGSEDEITINAPAQNQWVTVEIPIAAFANLNTDNPVAQIILSGEPSGGGTVYVDNIYFASKACDTEPIAAAPAPDCDAEDVQSLFSNYYPVENTIPVQTFRTVWSDASLTDIQIDGNDTKLYENINFLGIEPPISDLIDLSEMLHLNIDIWTPNMTEFRIKLVSFGPDGLFKDGGVDQAPNDDSEHEIAINGADLPQNCWVRLKIPITDFTGLLELENIAQIILSGFPTGAGTLYVDNLYFSGPGCSDVPLTAAPDPDCPAEDVISVYSDAYTDVIVDTYQTVWSIGNLVPNVMVEGNPTLLYENLDFVGITMEANQIDASEMLLFHLDIWSPNMTEFRVKLVDFGADGAFGGGDDTEDEVNFRVFERREWVPIDITLESMTTLTGLDKISQIILSGDPTGEGMVYVDNMYFANCTTNPLPACPMLVWEDNFNGTDLDATKWSYQIGDGSDLGIPGWGNQELQYYREENTTVSDGTLKITAQQESFGGYDYTSSRIRTENKGDWTYGRFEASIKLPIGAGMWPAFWMLPTDYVYGIWPQSGEIDIMEYLGQEPDKAFGTIHYGQLFPNNSFTSAEYLKYNGNFSDEFHEFAIEWEENEIRWYIDDYLYGTKTPADLGGEFWPFDQDFHFILNVAVGGTLGGPVDDSMLPQVMEVDYVRVYKGHFPYLAGNRFVDFQATGEMYTVENAKDGSTFTWDVPDGATITDGQGTNKITVDWGSEETSGDISVIINDGCNVETFTHHIEVDILRSDALECVLEDFDSEALITYETSIGVLEDNFANPSVDANNPSALVGKYTRDGGAEFDFITYSTDAIEDADDFREGAKTFRMDMYTDAPIGTEILIQLESSAIANPSNFPAGRHSTYHAFTTTQNAWENLTFTLAERPDPGTPPMDIDRIFFLFDRANFSSNVYYYDNFEKYCTDDERLCFDEMDFNLGDPCSCDNPANLILPNGEFLFNDTVMIDASALSDPINLSFVSQTGAMLTERGETLTAANVQIIDLGNDMFGIPFYQRPNTSAEVVINGNGQLRSITTSSCDLCPGIAQLPAMNNWKPPTKNCNQLTKNWKRRMKN